MVKNTEAKFWARVAKTDSCWIWTGLKIRQGYGRFSLNGKNWLAHRLAFLFTYGEFPDDLCVLHNCDNPSCVRPDHLRLGSIRDNNADTMVRGRHRHGEAVDASGENNNFHRFTWQQIREIRALKGKLSAVEIAQRFGTKRTYVNQILSGYRWREGN